MIDLDNNGIVHPYPESLAIRRDHVIMLLFGYHGKKPEFKQEVGNVLGNHEFVI